VKTVSPAYGFFVLLAAGVPVLLLPFTLSLYWAACLLLVALAGATLYLTRRWPDRAFYVACAGQPAVIACGNSGIPAGLFAEAMLAGMVAGTMGLLSSRGDYGYLLLFWGILVLLALVVSLSNHVFFLFPALAGILALLAGTAAVSGYRFRKECSGARP
jgi:hypothetical protein